jgi:hypothetical protein
MLAGSNILRRKPYDLTIFMYGITALDCSQGNLVPARYLGRSVHPAGSFEQTARREGQRGNGDIIQRI